MVASTSLKVGRLRRQSMFHASNHGTKTSNTDLKSGEERLRLQYTMLHANKEGIYSHRENESHWVVRPT